MNSRKPWLMIVVALAAALAGGVTVVLVMRRAPETGPAADKSEADEERIERLQSRLESLEAALRARPAASRTRTETTQREAAPPAADPEAERAATVAEVKKFLEERLKNDERLAPEHRFDLGVGDAGTKSLEDAAKELRLEPQKVEQIQDAFRKEGEDQLKAVFGTEDIEAIRNRIRDAENDSAARAKLQDELLANLLRTLPQIRRAEAAKVKALKEALGADGYERFHRLGVQEGKSDEFDALLERTFAE